MILLHKASIILVQYYVIAYVLRYRLHLHLSMPHPGGIYTIPAIDVTKYT